MNDDIRPGKIIMTLIAIALIIFFIGLYVKYADTPVGELPLWVYWLIGWR